MQRRKVYVRGVARIDAPDGPVALRAAGLFVMVASTTSPGTAAPGDIALTDRSWNP